MFLLPMEVSTISVWRANIGKRREGSSKNNVLTAQRDSLLGTEAFTLVKSPFDMWSEQA
jgi:hypothetical protein